MFELSIALRFLREGRVQTLLILVGIAVGIAVQIFLSALIGGLQKDLINRTVGTAPHITAAMPERKPLSLLPDSVAAVSIIAGSEGAVRPLRGWQALVDQLNASGWFTAVCPVADGPGFAARGEKTDAVVIRGVDLDRADQIYQVKRRLTSGTAAITSSSVLVGSELAADLRLQPGSTIRIAASTGGQDVFTVAGIFDLESKPVNATWVLMPLSRAQSLLGFEGGVTAIETQIPRVFESQTITETLRGSFPRLQWTSWQESNANLLAALKSQSGSSNLIQVLVLLAVTLGISSVLAVSAIQKARQIGILKAIGATRATIGRVFLIMGGLLGLAGAVAGCFAGYWLITAFLSATADATGTPLFPLSIEPSLYVTSVAIAVIAGTLAAFVPARRSATMNPIEVIRNG
jgi:lipoprotein-releasing system permease protein